MEMKNYITEKEGKIEGKKVKKEREKEKEKGKDHREEC